MTSKTEKQPEEKAPARAPCSTYTPRPDVSTIDGKPVSPAKEKA